ncbi:universal stress protein [Reichenbachiella ulvae]|uniref:Universal stress protein n=1 Tax=Reichenbachiella ulvae TaxID=2980104 RepID=A0ABT3CRK5_9BACT|nr:universal stress protein [Reichenbachiella ulvae]MCV9386252.1 universal stress protein [Reichenbachiella ulvae]
MKKIVVPYDFSHFADSALKFALELNNVTDSEVTLLHIIEYPLATTFNVTGEIAPYDDMDKLFTLELIKKAKKDLENMINKAEYSNHNLHYKVMMGNVYDGITSHIDEVEPDLIVMGTKGATGLKEILVGSNAEKVVRTAKCPVITVHTDQEVNAIRNIVFPTDLDITAGHVVEKFKEFQQLFNAKIHLVYVETPHSAISDGMAIEAMERLAEEYKLNNYQIHTTKGFQTDEAVLNFAQDIKADMIALATHSYKGLLHLFVGSVAEDIVNHSNIPVWTMSQKHVPKHA